MEAGSPRSAETSSGFISDSTPIERMLSARLDRVETEVSRLRSVVYLLVKERPELLRLLGETPLS